MNYITSDWHRLDASDYKELPFDPGVYMLVNKHGSPQYIGQSTALSKRVSSRHPYLWTATDILYCLCCHGDRLELERDLIKHYRPQWNIQHNPDHITFDPTADF